MALFRPAHLFRALEAERTLACVAYVSSLAAAARHDRRDGWTGRRRLDLDARPLVPGIPAKRPAQVARQAEVLPEFRRGGALGPR